MSRAVISDLERGRIERHTVDALRSVAESLGASVRIDLVVPGGDLRRLLDADHARLQAIWLDGLVRMGWEVAVETTFNHYGERGSIDLLAWHAKSRTLLVVEIKTVVADLQDLLATLDRKLRLARRIAAERGWLDPERVLPLLIVAEGTTARRRVATHEPLFRRFDRRGRAALAWLRAPGDADAPRGLLCFSKLPHARSGDRRRAGRRRIRPVSADSRSGTTPSPPSGA